MAPTTTADRASRVWVPVLAGLLLVGGGIAGHQLGSAVLHERASAIWAATDARYDRAGVDLASQVDQAESLGVRAVTLREVLSAELAGAEALAALDADLELLGERISAPPARPASGEIRLSEPDVALPAWVRYADLVRLHELVPARVETAVRLEVAADQVLDARRAVDDDIRAVFDQAATAAEAQLSAATSASHRSRLAVERLIDDIDDTGVPPGADAYRALAEAVAELQASHAAEEARKLTREYPVRAEIEAFARSIAAGVPLDFSWAYEVAGKPSDGWLAGTAELWPDGGGWSHVTLSESISDSWPDENARAVVVHEVGHTQALRPVCAAIFSSPVFGGEHEVWATAWAIGMGYDLPGAGIEAYGRPSDEQIEASKGCR
ncbi:hypothetical protein ABIQ69_12125 [Agromyces sp. G08B096]|uniref:Uncharacterized protein n=1 Tax=Agromyces sp. G08B096 TaxID=3156399 RepID=A0AAU7W6H0_9MICO